MAKKTKKAAAPKKAVKPTKKKVATKKVAPKKVAPKKVVKKKVAPKKVVAKKKAAPKKVAPKKVVKKKVAPKKVVIKKKTTPKKVAPKKVVAKKKAAQKKVTPKKVVTKKVVAKKKTTPKKVAPKKTTKVVIKKKVVIEKATKKITPKAVATKKEVKAQVVIEVVAKPKVVKEKKVSKKAKKEVNDRHSYNAISDDITNMLIEYKTPSIHKPLGPTPKPFINNDQRTRYSNEELKEFKELILKKLEEAKKDFELLKSTLSHKDDHGTDDTSPTFKLLEDGSDVLSKEETAHLANRQEKFIQNLQNALIRIENKTYGICRITGKLIAKERLRSVPHATLAIGAKLDQR